MRQLFASPHAIDVVLGLMLVEALILFALGRRRGPRGAHHSDWFYCLLSGASLLAALRAALAHSSWEWVVLPLLLSGAAHAADMRRRLRR